MTNDIIRIVLADDHAVVRAGLKAVLALVEGELQIASAPGRGTRVLARVPKQPDDRG